MKTDRIILGQLALGLVAWSLLAWATYRSARSPLTKLIVASAIFLFSQAPNFAGVYKTILTESLSYSFFVAACACALLYAQGWKIHWLFGATIFAILFAKTRDSNAYLMAMGGGILFLVSLVILLGFYKDRFSGIPQNHAIIWLITSFLLIGVFIQEYQASNTMRRWLYPLFNITSQRIIPASERTQWFCNHGMPMSDMLIKLKGQWAFSERHAYYQHPQLDSFRTWIYSKGKQTYILWLLTHPVYFFTEPLKDFFSVVSYDLSPDYTSKNYRPISSGIWFFILMVLQTLFVLGLIAQRLIPQYAQSRGVFFFLFIMLALSYPHLLIVWHADAMEVQRHAAAVAIQFQLGLFLYVLFSIDAIIALMKLIFVFSNCGVSDSIRGFNDTIND